MVACVLHKSRGTLFPDVPFRNLFDEGSAVPACLLLVSWYRRGAGVFAVIRDGWRGVMDDFRTFAPAKFFKFNTRYFHRAESWKGDRQFSGATLVVVPNILMLTGYFSIAVIRPEYLPLAMSTK
jgi:hypothetical protein